MRKVQCGKCGFIGGVEEFPKGYDFFQHPYISGCPKCDNRQSPGDASMRMFGGSRPFSFVDAGPEPSDPLEKTLHRAAGAS